ncbi:MAG: hypothetical protein O3C57_04705, partial [Verrucomicrobia bacterium]|nr:hypothetical protein [Verrucomicrobiota bacterium]
MQKLIFTLVCIPILLGPWFFGAWESWWFWIFAVILFAGVTLFGIRQLRRALHASPPQVDEPITDETMVWEKRQRLVTLLCLPFLTSAAWSLTRPIIYMTAERSFLVFLTPILLAAVIVFGMNSRERRLLFFLMILDLFLLGLYGVVNHMLTDSQYVLWAPGHPQYTVDHRASGSYYCPNHFAGIMEMAAAIGLGITLTRRVSTPQRFVGIALVALSGVAILMSKS